MNNEHVAGGSSVYEVINQYQAFKDDNDVNARDRRFDNLGKGASGAAVQNMNLMLGFEETAGLAL